ncbi:MAG: helix-turn-helix domain-containing protein, partial [Ktedonobacteraceae bacterium]|nr:helix-turn-helix domain-containing protein [Ktedonobacteraceae bacterium]
MSMKAYKYRIYGNKQTTEKLQWVLDRCRELYNAGLQERRDAYELCVKRHPNYYDEESRKQLTREHAIGYYEQKRELVGIKEERPEYQEIASHVLQDVILRLKRAYDRFFERVKNGAQPVYPRFEGRNRYDSFTYPDGAG